MKIFKLDWNKFVALFAWGYVIEATTFYVKSNTMDHTFKIFSVFLMLFMLIKSGRWRNLRINYVCILYMLLLFCGIFPDFFSGYFSTGFTVMASYVIQLFLFLFVYNRFYNIDEISKWLFTIPVIYGVIISTMGILQEISSVIGLPITVWVEKIESTGDTDVALCSLFGIPLGVYATWGSLIGTDLLRIQGFYIEPSKMAMFLIISIFFAWGLYRQTMNSMYRYALWICIGCFILTMSRAGFVAIIASLIVKKFYYKSNAEKKDFTVPKTTIIDLLKLISIATVIVIVAVIVLILMVELSKSYPELNFLYEGITNVSSGRANLIREETVDTALIFEGLLNQPYGFGFANNLHGSVSSVLDTNLANAFFFWLVTAGLLGAAIAVFIILFAMIYYAIPCVKSKEPIKVAVGLSFFGLMIHSLSYGSWMTSEFLMIMAIMLVIYNKNTNIVK